MRVLVVVKAKENSLGSMNFDFVCLYLSSWESYKISRLQKYIILPALHFDP